MEERTVAATFSYRVIIEPDEDRWFASCPALDSCGAATWGYTFEEALAHIQEVVQMIVEELISDGEPLPRGAEVDQP
jgi:predicted RNase H-like HicB family nuclease